MATIFGDDGVDDLFNDNHTIANEGDDDQLPSDGEPDNGEKLFGDDADADEAGAGGEAIKVEPKKRAVRNPRPRLTVDKLRGPRGLHTIENYFKDIKYKGKGHEKADLDEVLRRLQHWGHRMYPNYTFDDVLNNIERLGKKKPLQVHMTRYRLGQLDELNLQDEVRDEQADDEDADGAAAEPFDEFDALLGEQIAMSKLAPRTPAVNKRNTSVNSSNSTLVTPSFSRHAVVSTPYSVAPPSAHDMSDYGQPLPPSQPATPSAQKLSSDQMARIAENRRLAQERLRAKQMEAAGAQEPV
ncbi:protein TIPIN homolog [Drosophila nasuta]|uniref:TIMELESS-interacting protein n=1 Tax=Drosophila albomicans TaxID=7291 RepID=A0A6P8W151_DROAB|nr:protein TIPIN homolog [Drosophila albomicans]XP_060652037.1 protein TIPIN homolog [Drosophila nasuta]